MIKEINGCCGCETCIGRGCTQKIQKIAVCDFCETESDIFYDLDGEWLCEDCYKETIFKTANTITSEQMIERDEND